MPNLRVITRAGAALAAGGLVLGLSAIPAGSQELDPITITGTYACVTDGGESAWAIDYTITNDLVLPEPDDGPAPTYEVDIVSATLSGAADGSPEFDPTTIPVEGEATASGFVDGTASGLLTLTVAWDVPDFQAEGTATYDLTLEGTCAAPATTSSSAPAVEAVAVTPAFTG